MPVKKDRLGLLTAALRSGDYMQGQGALHRIITRHGTEKHEWCCLGVACDVAGKAGLALARTIDGNDESFDGEDSYLPREVADWYGFSSTNPGLLTPAGCQDASEVNDEGYYLDEDDTHVSADFGMIAQFFEDTYLKD
jgi:hypothetical protein